MSDPASVLRPGLATWLRTDTEVIAAFGAKTVKILSKLPPVNEPYPYIFIAGLDVEDDTAECLDATQVILQIDVWSLTSPPSFTEAETIAKAVKSALTRMEEDIGNSPEFSISGFRVVAVQHDRTSYLTDPSDGKTVHAVIRATLSVDPTG
jgi:hypothetical protein